MSRVYRALLRLYPARFRERYQAELVAASRPSARDIRAASDWLRVLDVHGEGPGGQRVPDSIRRPAPHAN